MAKIIGNQNQVHPSGVLIYGFDGTNANPILIDASKRQVVSVTGDTGDFATSANSVFTLAGTAITGTCLAANNARLCALFQNLSDTDYYLSMGGTAIAGSTMPYLAANGGYYEMSKKHGNLYSGSVNAACAASAKILAIVEGT